MFLWLLLGKQFCGQYYKIYDVVFTPSYRSKEASVEGIYRNLLSSVRRHKYDVVNFIIQAPVYPGVETFNELKFFLNSAKS